MTRAEAADRLEALSPGYLERVRRLSARLAHRDSPVIDVVTTLVDVVDTSALDLDAPTLSRLRTGRLIKESVRRLVGWYLRYLTVQVAAFTAAVTRFGSAVVERTDELEAATTALAAEVEGLRRRLERLEEAGGAPPAAPRPGPDRPA